MSPYVGRAMHASGESMTESGADFSKDRVYRYRLWRIWNWNRPLANFMLLNPSYADEKVNDPTVERCVRRSHMWGYGGTMVTNIFGLRATDPTVLVKHADPIGPDNNAFLLAEAKAAGVVICGWGVHGTLRQRDKEISALLEGIPLYALGFTVDGQPRHPLYLPYTVLPVSWGQAPPWRKP